MIQRTPEQLRALREHYTGLWKNPTDQVWSVIMRQIHVYPDATIIKCFDTLLAEAENAFQPKPRVIIAKCAQIHHAGKPRYSTEGRVPAIYHNLADADARAVVRQPRGEEMSFETFVRRMVILEPEWLRDKLNELDGEPAGSKAIARAAAGLRAVMLNCAKGAQASDVTKIELEEFQQRQKLKEREAETEA